MMISLPCAPAQGSLFLEQKKYGSVTAIL